MLDRTRQLWEEQDEHTGDRLRLFTAVAGAVEATEVLYPGSYVDLAPSFVWPTVTHVDVDARARRFFGDDASFDLLVSLYAGFVSEHCPRYLRVGGTLLVNPSHGDAAMASIDTRYRLQGLVTARDGHYAVRSDDLDTYLVSRREIEVTATPSMRAAAGVGYTRSPFAYLVARIA